MAWKIYFVFLAVLVVGSLLGRIIIRIKRPDLVKRFDIISSVVGSISLVGIYGYVYSVPIATRGLWIFITIVVFVFWVLEFFQPKTKHLVANIGRLKASLLLGATTLLTLPGYIALLLYAFGRHPWLA